MCVTQIKLNLQVLRTASHAEEAAVSYQEKRACVRAQLCLTLSGPLDCSQPDSAHGISQARQTGVGCLPDPGIEPTSPVSPKLAGGFFTTEPPGKPLEAPIGIFKFTTNNSDLIIYFPDCCPLDTRNKTIIQSSWESAPSSFFGFTFWNFYGLSSFFHHFLALVSYFFLLYL